MLIKEPYFSYYETINFLSDEKPVWLLITLFSVIANVNVCAQELDFSKLDDAQPQETLLQVENYKEALGTTWQNIPALRWSLLEMCLILIKNLVNILYTQITQAKRKLLNLI